MNFRENTEKENRNALSRRHEFQSVWNSSRYLAIFARLRTECHSLATRPLTPGVLRSRSGAPCGGVFPAQCTSRAILHNCDLRCAAASPFLVKISAAQPIATPVLIVVVIFATEPASAMATATSRVFSLVLP